MIPRIITISLMIAIVILCIAIPIAIGSYVVNDAKKRNMNTVLWTLISVLAPGFIGLIIYLIARTGYSVLNCPKCGKNINENFVVCPHCGFSLGNNCPVCGRALEYDWNICPSCTNPVPENMKLDKPVKRKKDKGLKRILILVILIPVLLCLLIIAGIYMFVADDTHIDSFYATHVEPEDVNCSEIDVGKWIADCDKEGEGVYVLTADTETENGATTKFLVYRNDGMYDAHDSLVNGMSGGIFRNPEVEIAYYDPAIEYGTGLSYYEFYSDRPVEANITTEGEITDYQIIEVADIEYAVTQEEMDGASFSVTIPVDRADVYELSVQLYQGDIQASEFGTTSSDGVPLTGTFSDIIIDYNSCLKYDYFAICLKNADSEEILKSEKYPLWSDNGELKAHSSFYIQSTNGKEMIVTDDGTEPVSDGTESETLQ